MAHGGTEVRCTRCQYFVIRIWTRNAEFELNCPNTRCRTTLKAKVTDSQIAVVAMPSAKQQA